MPILANTDHHETEKDSREGGERLSRAIADIYLAFSEIERDKNINIFEFERHKESCIVNLSLAIESYEKVRIKQDPIKLFEEMEYSNKDEVTLTLAQIRQVIRGSSDLSLKSKYDLMDLIIEQAIVLREVVSSYKASLSKTQENWSGANRIIFFTNILTSSAIGVSRIFYLTSDNKQNPGTDSGLISN